MVKLVELGAMLVITPSFDEPTLLIGCVNTIFLLSILIKMYSKYKKAFQWMPTARLPTVHDS